MASISLSPNPLNLIQQRVLCELVNTMLSLILSHSLPSRSPSLPLSLPHSPSLGLSFRAKANMDFHHSSYPLFLPLLQILRHRGFCRRRAVALCHIRFRIPLSAADKGPQPRPSRRWRTHFKRFEATVPSYPVQLALFDGGFYQTIHQPAVSEVRTIELFFLPTLM